MKTIILFSLLSITLISGMDVGAYDKNLKYIDGTTVSCGDYKSCFNAYNLLTNISNTIFVCYSPDPNGDGSECIMLGPLNDGSYMSFSINPNGEILKNTFYNSTSFSVNMLMQWMNYNEFWYVESFCLSSFKM